MPWFVYILRCGDGSLYTGITTDLAKRLAAHRRGRGSKYTRARHPLALVYLESRASRSAALRREAAVKSLPRAQKLRLIAEHSAGREGAARPGSPSHAIATRLRAD